MSTAGSSIASSTSRSPSGSGGRASEHPRADGARHDRARTTYRDARAADRGRAGRASGSSSPPNSTTRRAGSVAIQSRLCAVGRRRRARSPGSSCWSPGRHRAARRRAGAEESEARFRRIANSAPAMMWVTRLDRVRDFVNDAYVDFVCGPGATARRRGSSTGATRIHPDDVDRIVAESIAGEASRQPFTLEGRYQRHDGEYRWLRSVSQPRFGADGELVGFIGVAERHHFRQGGRARASPPGRGADRASSRAARRGSARCSTPCSR